MRIARFTVLFAAALAVLVAVPITVLAALPGGAKYAGKTDDGGSVTLRLSSNAKRVKKMRIHYTVECNDGRSGKTYTDILNLRIKPDRTFHGKGTYTGSGDGSDNKFNVSGKISKRKASGTFSLTATSSPDSQGPELKCKTGKLTWSAKRKH